MNNTIVFYGKPGCINNRKQIRLLEGSGINVEVVNLLEHQWTPQKLDYFFASLPLEQCINKSSPLVKSGAFVIAEVSREEVLAAMCEDPVLIRRPLLEYHDNTEVGFDWLQLCRDFELLEQPLTEDVEKCTRENRL